MILSNNPLTSLKDIHKKVKRINGAVSVSNTDVKSHVLGLLMIEGITELFIEEDEVADIIHDYLGSHNNPERILECQEELIDAGFEEYAQP